MERVKLVTMSDLETYRSFLKDTLRKEVDFSSTDQRRGLPPPPVQKPFSSKAKRIDLPKMEELKTVGSHDLTRAIQERQSTRNFSSASLSLEELAYLLWATQGVREEMGEGHAFRTVPSAGCRHAFETYLSILRVEGLEPGIYRYLPLQHQLVFEFDVKNLPEEIEKATLGQHFVTKAAATFIWTAIPYRMEWRYGLVAHKVIALDAGHVCQNLYLACQAISAGTCAIAAYDQEEADRLLRLDGKEEFVVYLAPVGKIT